MTHKETLLHCGETYGTLADFKAKGFDIDIIKDLDGNELSSKHIGKNDIQNAIYELKEIYNILSDEKEVWAIARCERKDYATLHNEVAQIWRDYHDNKLNSKSYKNLIKILECFLYNVYRDMNYLEEKESDDYVVNHCVDAMFFAEEQIEFVLNVSGKVSLEDILFYVLTIVARVHSRSVSIDFNEM